MTRKTGFMVDGPGFNAREYSIRPEYPIGALVVTPLGKVAKIAGYTKEGRVRVIYTEGLDIGSVELFPKLLRAYAGHT
jgi:hypothetical protein